MSESKKRCSVDFLKSKFLFFYIATNRSDFCLFCSKMVDILSNLLPKYYGHTVSYTKKLKLCVIKAV